MKQDRKKLEVYLTDRESYQNHDEILTKEDNGNIRKVKTNYIYERILSHITHLYYKGIPLFWADPGHEEELKEDLEKELNRKVVFKKIRLAVL